MMLTLNRSVVAALLLVLGADFGHAADFSFTIKGRSLGQSTEIACQGVAPSSQEALLRDAGVVDIQFPAESCQVYLDSVAGVSADEYARLLFWRGKLIRMVIPFGSLDLEPLAALRETLVNAYGRPAVKRSSPFRTDVWRKGEERLELEQTDRLPSEVDLYLTQSVAWAEYLKARQQADLKIKQLQRSSRQRNLIQ